MTNSLYNAYFVVSVGLTLCYAFFICMYVWYWRRLPLFEPQKAYVPRTFISVLIPARNEEANIEACLRSILANHYPRNLLEIIVIDDHSEDATPQYVRRFEAQGVRLLSLKNYVELTENQPFKKRAIEAAIGVSRGDLIVTTDADCVAQPHWLVLIAQFYEQKNKRFIAAPVNFHAEKSWLEVFQSLDYMGMMGITGAGVEGRFTHMCNGANLAYEKKLFYAVDGFKDIDHVASGDDMLLMQKVARFHPEALGFLKHSGATVFTEAKPTIADFMSQRRRWASKSSSYTEFFTVFQLAIVFLFSCNVLVNTLLTPFLGWSFGIILLLQLTLKFSVDFVFLRTMMRFFKREDLLYFFLPSQYLHIAYIAVIGTLANVRKTYVWKGRRVR